jgi:sulfate transport system permease protein
MPNFQHINVKIFAREGSAVDWHVLIPIFHRWIREQALPGMLLATIFISLPFVIREVMPVLAQVSLDQENAAYTMGASRWQTFWRVTLPAIRWGLLYGVSLTFARAVGEIGAVLVVSGGVSGLTETSTLFIFRSLDDRNYIGANAMAVVLAAISFVVLMVIEFLKKRTEASR